MHDAERTANLLGAASLALTDLVLAETTRVGQLSTSSTAALVSLCAIPGPSVSELGRRVGLSQPAAARMVDSLTADGLVEQIPSTANRRWMTVRPTAHGHRLAQQLLRGRSTPLMGIVTRLGEPDQERLAGLLEEILTHLYDDVGQGQRICRLCDRASCVRSATCPVGQAERAERP